MRSRRRNAPSVPASLQRLASASNRRFSLPENCRRLAIATTSGSRRTASKVVSPAALRAPSATASEQEPDNPFNEDFTNEVMCMSYLYSKLPETVVSPLIGTGGAAVALGLEDGAKLRVETTVVETDIHHPTDNTLLWDVVRVVTRLIGRLAKALEMRRIKGFRDRRRSAHRRMYEIQRMTTKQRQGAGSRQTATYRELIGIAEEVVANAKTAVEKTAYTRGKDLFAAMTINAIRDEIVHYCGLGARVIDQARRRVLDGEQVPNAEKIYSIFEPHTDLIKRGKVRTPVEFGHKVFLAESAKGLITQYEVLKGNPCDEVHVAPSLKRHRRAFGRAPELYASDRGFFSEQNVTACVHGAVTTVSIPQRGGSKTPQRHAYERSAAFKQGQRFRAGIEGRISVLMRGRGMKRCRADGAERFALFVGAAVLANNLMIVAALLTRQSSRRRKAAR